MDILINWGLDETLSTSPLHAMNLEHTLRVNCSVTSMLLNIIPNHLSNHPLPDLLLAEGAGLDVGRGTAAILAVTRSLAAGSTCNSK